MSPSLELGGNYTQLDPENVSDPGTKVTDVPKRKVTVHAVYRPVGAVDLVAFVENSSDRWVSNTVKLGNYTTLNAKVAYRPMKAMTLEAGVNNATDRNYELANGYPQPGRMWYASASYTF